MAVRHFLYTGHSPFVFKLQVLYRKKDAFAPEKVGRMKIKAYICLRKHRICFLRGVPVSVVQGDRLRLYPLNLMQVMLPKGIGINRFFVKPCGRGWLVLLFHGGKTMVKTSENTVREFALPASICPLLRVVPTKPGTTCNRGFPFSSPPLAINYIYIVYGSNHQRKADSNGCRKPYGPCGRNGTA